MSGNQTVLYHWRAPMKTGYVLNLVPPILTPWSQSPNTPGLPQTAQQIRAEFAFRHHISGIINRFVRHPLIQIVIVSKALLEYASALRRGSAIIKKVFHNTMQHGVGAELRPASSALPSSSGAVTGYASIVIPFWTVGLQFPTDAARRSVQLSGHWPDARTISLHQHDHSLLSGSKCPYDFSIATIPHSQGVVLGF